MRKMFIAAALLGAVSLTSIAIAQTTPDSVPDARSLASDQQVGVARRAYRAACQQHENASFCECLTAGVAQSLVPDEVRLAARTFAERAPIGSEAYRSEMTAPQSSAERIAQAEAQYAGACAQFR